MPFAELPRQRKLRDEEDLPSRIEDAAVHLVVLVAEDPEPHEFAGEIVRLLLGVTAAHRKKYGESAFYLPFYLAVHGQHGTERPLNDRPHILSSPFSSAGALSAPASFRTPMLSPRADTAAASASASPLGRLAGGAPRKR